MPWNVKVEHYMVLEGKRVLGWRQGFGAELRKLLRFRHYSELAPQAGAWNTGEDLPLKSTERRSKMKSHVPCPLFAFLCLFATKGIGRHRSRIYFMIMKAVSKVLPAPSFVSDLSSVQFSSPAHHKAHLGGGCLYIYEEGVLVSRRVVLTSVPFADSLQYLTHASLCLSPTSSLAIPSHQREDNQLSFLTHDEAGGPKKKTSRRRTETIYQAPTWSEFQPSSHNCQYYECKKRVQWTFQRHLLTL